VNVAWGVGDPQDNQSIAQADWREADPPFLLVKLRREKYRLAEFFEPGEVTGKGNVWLFFLDCHAAPEDSRIVHDRLPRQTSAQ
jgi:hypothetical protein